MPAIEALGFFKLWKMSSAATGNLIPPPEYDDDHYFFDLDLNVTNYDLNRSKSTEISSSDSDEDDESFESKSPISFLRSPTNFPIFSMFRKRSTEKTGAGDESPAALGLVNCSRRKMKRPKDVVSRYLRRMKVMISRSSGEFSPESPLRKVPEDGRGVRSPSMRVVCRRLGKSRSAAPAVVVTPVANVNGDLVLHNDGIQSAILHCKKSYNSSRDLSVLSRSVSEPVISGNPSRFSIEEKKRVSI